MAAKEIPTTHQTPQQKHQQGGGTVSKKLNFVDGGGKVPVEVAKNHETGDPYTADKKTLNGEQKRQKKSSSRKKEN